MKACIKTNVTQIFYGFRKHTSTTLLRFHVTQTIQCQPLSSWPFSKHGRINLDDFILEKELNLFMQRTIII